MDTEKLSSACPFWDKLDWREQKQLIEGSVEAVYEKGMNVHRSDMGCRGAILLLTGVLRVYIISDQGREVTLFRIRGGENCVLSASCLMDSIEFDVLIEAVQAARAIVIPVNVLHPLMERNPHVGLFMYRQVTERFSDVMWTMQQILFMGADRRVAMFLWDEMINAKVSELFITHDEIAKNIGSAREVVTKVLKYFGDEGILAAGRGKVVILDKEKLKKVFM
ncbi:MAG: Crp/Fnr family transcriptional regulator [Hungatella sp.]|jgi:CRP/FNR family transcriptional regulator|nr:Crp/Fnr family transcriptional regulator [Hungatella sp.]